MIMQFKIFLKYLHGSWQLIGNTCLLENFQRIHHRTEGLKTTEWFMTSDVLKIYLLISFSCKMLPEVKWLSENHSTWVKSTLHSSLLLQNIFAWIIVVCLQTGSGTQPSLSLDMWPQLWLSHHNTKWKIIAAEIIKSIGAFRSWPVCWISGSTRW